MLKKLLLLTCCLGFCLFFGIVESSWAWLARVVKVADGDTITVIDEYNQSHRIRLYGIDCPEKNQPFGNTAKNFVSKAIAHSVVDIIEKDRDRYGRIVAIVKISDTLELQHLLVGYGLAWVYPQYCKEPVCSGWQRLEAGASLAKRGLWQESNAIPPWQWRRKK